MEVMPEEEVLTLDNLEERILRAVELVNTLRKERDALARKLEQIAEEKDSSALAIEAAKAEAARLQQELDSLRSERKQVRTRIEKLLGQMELLTDQ